MLSSSGKSTVYSPARTLPLEALLSVVDGLMLQFLTARALLRFLRMPVPVCPPYCWCYLDYEVHLQRLHKTNFGKDCVTDLQAQAPTGSTDQCNTERLRDLGSARAS